MVELIDIKGASIWRVLVMAKVNALKATHWGHTMDPVVVQVLGGNWRSSPTMLILNQAECDWLDMHYLWMN
jgi:hypothetical protein